VDEEALGPLPGDEFIAPAFSGVRQCSVLVSVDDVNDVVGINEIREQTHKPVYALPGGLLFDDPFFSDAADLDRSAVRFAGQAHGDQNWIQLAEAATTGNPPDPVLIIDGRGLIRQQRVLHRGEGSMNWLSRSAQRHIQDQHFFVRHGLEVPGSPPSPAPDSAAPSYSGTNLPDGARQDIVFVVVLNQPISRVHAASMPLSLRPRQFGLPTGRRNGH
jgi:hypothetical protein